MRAALVISGALASALAATAAESPSPQWFVGEKVVCVNNRFLDLSDAPELVEGRVYTISDILPARRGFLGIAVEEVRAKTRYLAFDERRFELVALFAAARRWRRDRNDDFEAISMRPRA